MDTLNPQEEIFVAEYLKDCNATRSAIAAGYSERTASVIGHEVLHRERVAMAIAEAMQERINRTKLDADHVLVRLGEMLDADPLEILNEVGAFKPLNEWPLHWRRMISGIKIKELFDGKQGNRFKIGETVDIKFVDKLAALGMIGKHIDVQAFTERKLLGNDPKNPLPETPSPVVVYLPDNGRSDTD